MFCVFSEKHEPVILDNTLNKRLMWLSVMFLLVFRWLGVAVCVRSCSTRKRCNQTNNKKTTAWSLKLVLLFNEKASIKCCWATENNKQCEHWLISLHFLSTSQYPQLQQSWKLWHRGSRLKQPEMARKFRITKLSPCPQDPCMVYLPTFAGKYAIHGSCGLLYFFGHGVTNRDFMSPHLILVHLTDFKMKRSHLSPLVTTYATGLGQGSG